MKLILSSLPEIIHLRFNPPDFLYFAVLDAAMGKAK
jgi:hypothetical protein